MRTHGNISMLGWVKSENDLSETADDTQEL